MPVETDDDSAEYRFWAWWAIRRHQHGAPPDLDDLAHFLQAVEEFEDHEATGTP
jgi:hypothetical protein